MALQEMMERQARMASKVQMERTEHLRWWNNINLQPRYVLLELFYDSESMMGLAKEKPEMEFFTTMRYIPH
jgi:hypothetical protein